MFLIKSADELIIDIYVQPGAKISQIIGVHGERLKIKISSPPVDGKANHEVIEFFSQLLNISRRDISLVSGEKSRNKRVKIIGSSEIIKQQIQGIIYG